MAGLTARMVAARVVAPLVALSVAGCDSGLPANTSPMVPTATTATTFELEGWSGQTRSYRCADGAHLAVAYLNPQQGVALAVVSVNNAKAPSQTHTQAVLRQLPTASGARYVDVDEQRGLRWRTQGDEGFLAMLAADHTATEQPLHTQCRALP